MKTRLLCAALLGPLGCGGLHQVSPPSGYVVVEDGYAKTRMKAGDNVGMTVSSFENMAGGTLQFWSEDLLQKLRARGYTHTGSEKVMSKDRVAGTRFDFDYLLPGTGDETFLIVVLLVTDRYRHVVQIAGDHARRESHTRKLPATLASLKVRGCKPRSKTCRGRGR